MSRNENPGCGYPIYWVLSKMLGVTPRDIVDPWGYDEKSYKSQPNSIEVLKRESNGEYSEVHQPKITNTRTGTEGFSLRIDKTDLI